MPPVAAALLTLFRQHGWDGCGFGAPLDASRLAARLKGFLYGGMRPCGGGSYSTVFQAVCKLSGAPVALKRIRLDRAEEGLPSVALREASLLRQLAGSPHIVQ